jgi:hypothetical protein
VVIINNPVNERIGATHEAPGKPPLGEDAEDEHFGFRVKRTG